MSISNESPWLNEIPSTEKILEEALEDIKIDLDNPSITAKRLEEKCYEIYKRYEAKVREEWKDKTEIDKLEKSLSQSRVSRAGHTVELILQRLLDYMGVEYERNVKINGEQLDLVIPNKETLKKDQKNAVIISIKRKVRERWREVVGEAYILRKIFEIPDNIWFVSLFEPPEYAVKIMVKLNIRVYIPDEYYNDEFKKLGARKFSEMFEELSRFRKTKTLSDF